MKEKPIDWRGSSLRDIRETRIKSPVRPELVEGLAVPIDCYRFNPIMVRQALMEQLSID